MGRHFVLRIERSSDCVKREEARYGYREADEAERPRATKERKREREKRVTASARSSCLFSVSRPFLFESPTLAMRKK